MKKRDVVLILVSTMIIVVAVAFIFEPLLFAQTLISLSKDIRKMLGFQSQAEKFSITYGASSTPKEGKIGGGTTTSSENYTSEQAYVKSVFAEIKSYVLDENINSNMSYYYRKYCSKFGISENQWWSGIITVISDDGQYVLAVMNVTYTNYRFYIDSLIVEPAYVIVVDYSGFVLVEQKVRAFAYSVMDANYTESEIVSQALDLAKELYYQLLNGHIDYYKLER